jgi:hypothetical protein
MFFRLARISLALLSLSILALGSDYVQTGAQEGGQIWLAGPDTTQFPQISLQFDIRDGQGFFIHGLDTTAVTILEDSNRIPAGTLTQVHPGVQLVLAVNPGPSFAIRNSQGQSRFEFVKQAFLTWGERRLGSTLDDLSLMANDLADQSHIAEVETWIDALGAYQPDARNAEPDLTVLARAIDLAADTPPRQGMGKAVLFITAPMDEEVAIGLESLGARAGQLGVRVFVWLVASTERFTSQSARQLVSLAEGTGGGYFAYSGLETIPDPEIYLAPLRDIYILRYPSRITTSGTHQLALSVRHEGAEISSDPVAFDVEVLPPNVAFISPRLEIDRQLRPQGQTDEQTLTPQQENLEILIEFPDGHPRPVKRSKLFVDGQVVQVNERPPFDQFGWDLRDYDTTAEHHLKVEVSDSLGLTGASMETVITVAIKRDPQSIVQVLSRNRSWVAGTMVLLAGAILLLVLIRGGQLRPGFLLHWRRRRRQRDPASLPIHPRPAGRSQGLPALIDRLNWTQRRLAPDAKAFLMPISEPGTENNRLPLSISGDDVTLGRNPRKVTHLVDDPCVEEVHARLERKTGGSFQLSDMGSTAGTWVNYMPVSKEGQFLEHGDLVHFGRVGFRFALKNPDKVRRPVIIQLEPEP